MSAEILIIEDEALIAFDIRQILTRLGYKVSQVIHNSEKAIDYLSFQTPDLVLCDIRIQGSADGIEVARKIREKKKLPFVFLTSLADRPTLERAKHALPYGYIVKPFDEKDLLTAIEVALFKFQQELEALTITPDKVNKLTVSDLTVREFDILEAMVKGWDYARMQDEFNISQNTLKYHNKNLFAKFEAANRAEVMQRLLLYFMSG